MELKLEKKIYFISDLHLGTPSPESSLDRERIFVQWLDEVSKDASDIYLLGDIFDFWFEYKHVIPRGFTRSLGKLSELSDRGIKLHFIIGNHDMWTFGYLEEEVGMMVYKDTVRTTINGKKFILAHGHDLGGRDWFFNMLKPIFKSRVTRWLFSRIHPNGAFGFAKAWSRHSRNSHPEKDYSYKGDDKEWMTQFCKDELEREYFDYCILGHRHLALDIDLGRGARYINLGEWISEKNYAVFDGENVELKSYKKS